MADAVPLSGSIDPKAFPFLIGHLHSQAATGSLKVDGPSYQKAIYFRGGRILFGSSNDPKDQLGAILIESGRISPEQLEDVNAKVGPGNPLAKVLAESGFVSQRELSEAARAKVERILSDVTAYTTGSFEFEDGVLPKGAVDLKLSTEKVIVAAVRRIADRNFVLRHVEGLDAVFVPAANAATPLTEIEADTGPVVRMFDGRRSLKEAAAAAALDEFDTAKVACGLLFLGFLERAATAAIETTVADSGPLFSPDELDSGLDLGGSGPSLGVEGSSEPDATLLISEPSPEAPLTSSLPEPEPALAEPPIPPPRAVTPPPRAVTPPLRAVTPAPRAPAAVAPPAPEPEPATMLLPSAPEMPATTVVGSAPYEPPSYEPPEEEAPPAAAAAPPSKEDLAALDALLNARHVEGPLEPLAKSAEARWEPHFGQMGRAGRPNKRSSRKPMLLAGAAAVLVVAGVAAWILLPRSTAPAPVKAPVTTLVEVAATTLPSETSTLAANPATTVAASPATFAAPTTTLRSARPASPAPVPPTTAPARAAAGGGLSDARAAFLNGDLAAAARGFTANLKAAGHDAHTVQILVACSDETVHKAAQAVSAPELFVVPVDYKGRSCYRVCWGIYESEAKARAAVSGVPDYFRKGGAVPKAVPAATVLP